MAIKRKMAPLTSGSLALSLITSKIRVQKLWFLSLLDKTHQDAGMASIPPEHNQSVSFQFLTLTPISLS